MNTLQEMIQFHAWLQLQAVFMDVIYYDSFIKHFDKCKCREDLVDFAIFG